MKLLTESSKKIQISNQYHTKYHSCILYLSPYNISGYNVCKKAVSPKSCGVVCLNTSGRGRTKLVQNARIRKTKLLFENRPLFKGLLFDDVRAFIRKCNRLNLKPAIRLNGTSDLDWMQIFPDIFTTFPQVKWYDYCKVISRYSKFLNNELPNNYHLTFSRHEKNEGHAIQFLENGGNVAVVFRNKVMPKKWNWYKVVSGDTHDLRFLDPLNVVVGLYAKGRARHDTSGFVVDIDEKAPARSSNARSLFNGVTIAKSAKVALVTR